MTCAIPLPVRFTVNALVAHPRGPFRLALNCCFAACPTCDEIGPLVLNGITVKTDGRLLRFEESTKLVCGSELGLGSLGLSPELEVLLPLVSLPPPDPPLPLPPLLDPLPPPVSPPPFPPPGSPPPQLLRGGKEIGPIMSWIDAVSAVEDRL